MDLRPNVTPVPHSSAARLFVIIFFSLGVFLRLLLCWANPPENAFDDHFKPIFMIMESGHIPPKDACFQCYHPPVFYWTSAMIGNVARRAGMAAPHEMKLLQFVSCFYGILTVAVCYLILKKFPLSDLARIVSFGAICFLPRHIYMCAMNSNDTIAYLFVTLSIYLAIVALERRFSIMSFGLLSIILTISLFTKYTAFVVVPAVVVGFFFAYRRLIVAPKTILVSALATFILPLAMLAGYMMNNERHYHSPLPWNVTIYDPSSNRPRDKEAISFVSFKPWEQINTLMLTPGQLHSFWTLVYGGMWFDTEPRFLPFLDSNESWWTHYYQWYRGEAPFPGKNPSLSSLTIWAGRGLMALGLVPLALILAGFGVCITGKWKGLFTATPAQAAALSLFPALLMFNVAGIIALTFRLPVYNAMKPSYFLNSISSFMLFLALGIMPCEKNNFLKRAIVTAFGALFTLATVHILHIAFAILVAG